MIWVPRILLRVTALAATIFWAAISGAAVVRYGVIVGNNVGNAQDVTLKHAEADAARIHATLKAVGSFPPENLLLLQGERPEVVQRALISINDRIRSTVSADTQVVLFVYFSGHGDAHFLHLGPARLELTLIEQLVRSSSATFRVLVVDACRSGAMTRVKGGSAAPPFMARASDALGGEGAVFLSSSSTNEDAQESDELQGSFFSHYFSSGLLGPADSDLDGQVTLEEAYRYAYSNTLRATSRTWAGAQHPTFRYELKGHGRVILTSPGTFSPYRSTLNFPAKYGFLVLAGGPEGSVVGEIVESAKNRSLSVSPGAYFIRARVPRSLLEGMVRVGPGASIEVDDSELDSVEYGNLVRKGGSEVRLVHGPVAGYTLRTPLPNATHGCHGIFAGYTWVLPWLTLTPVASACADGFENAWIEAKTQQFTLQLGLTHTWDTSWASFDAGLSAGVALHHQDFETVRLAPARTAAGPLLSLETGVSKQLGLGFFLSIGAAAEGYLIPMEHSVLHTTEFEPAAALRLRAGVGKLW